MLNLDRISFDPQRMGGKPCIRQMRVNVGMIVSPVARGFSHKQLLETYPCLEVEDNPQALIYAAWRAEEYGD